MIWSPFVVILIINSDLVLLQSGGDGIVVEKRERGGGGAENVCVGVGRTTREIGRVKTKITLYFIFDFYLIIFNIISLRFI